MLKPISSASEKEFLQWDIKTFRKALKFWESSINWNSVQKCLEIGAREGGLSLWLASHQKQVICSDLSNSRQIAEPLHSQFETSDLITYDDIDATNIPYKNEFDLIVFKSVLGGIGAHQSIEKQKQAMSSMYDALKPGGLILFAENLEASALHSYLRTKFTNWGAVWRYPNLEETKALFSQFSKLDLHTTGFLATLGRNEQQRSILNTGDRLLFNHVFPSGYHYLCYGIAVK